LLQSAGIKLVAEPSGVDERAIESAVENLDSADISQILAEVKATTVSEENHGKLVIGADQVLLFEGLALSKCDTMQDARRRLLALSGKTHQLSTAVCLARDGEIIWRHQTTANLTMQALPPAQIGQYLAEAGADVLQSVGCYHLEGIGIRLMEKIEGDYFSILGLPLLETLKAIAQYGRDSSWDNPETVH
jgi:septum formation protein